MSDRAQSLAAGPVSSTGDNVDEYCGCRLLPTASQQGGREEPSDEPVVTCTLRIAGVDRRTGSFTDAGLRSGNLRVFRGRNRAGAGSTSPRTAEHHDLRDRLS